MTTTTIPDDVLYLRSLPTEELERMAPTPRYTDNRILAELRRRDALAEGRIAPKGPEPWT